MLPTETAAPPARSDAELLRQFVETNSDEAFSELFRRHVDWIYSVALRQTGDRESAEDVTQAVFNVLARKAATLKRETVLSGWLFRVVRYTAIDAMRMEFRRRQREQTAATTIANEPDATWEEIAPLVDECLSNIRGADQRAILLRFYEQKSWREVGVALGVHENTARVRVDRALEKLKSLLQRNGVRSATSVLSAMLLANMIQSAPSSISIAHTTQTVTALTHAVLRRWLVRKILTSSFVVCVLICGVSFLAIPKSQNASQQTLLGADAFAALVEIDRGFWTGNATQFLSRIHFRNAADETFRVSLSEFILAETEFRRAAAKAFRDEQFGYYETLDVIFAGRTRPTNFGLNGNRAAGAFSRGRGIELVRIDGIWKWDFFNGFPAERLQRLSEETRRLRALTEDVVAGAAPSDILRKLHRP